MKPLTAAIVAAVMLLGGCSNMSDSQKLNSFMKDHAAVDRSITAASKAGKVGLTDLRNYTKASDAMLEAEKSAVEQLNAGGKFDDKFIQKLLSDLILQQLNILLLKEENDGTDSSTGSGSTSRIGGDSTDYPQSRRGSGRETRPGGIGIGIGHAGIGVSSRRAA